MVKYFTCCYIYVVPYQKNIVKQIDDYNTLKYNDYHHNKLFLICLKDYKINTYFDVFLLALL